MHIRSTFVLSLLLAVIFTATQGCADDPVAYSEVVSLKLSGLKPGDFDKGPASEDKNIASESGNPYAVFLRNARDALGGADPGAIELISVTLRVHADSKDVNSLDAVFADLEVFIATNVTTIPVAETGSPAGSSMVIPLIDPIDYGAVRNQLLSGDFKVGVRGQGVEPLPEDFDLRLSIDLRFQALE